VPGFHLRQQRLQCGHLVCPPDELVYHPASLPSHGGRRCKPQDLIDCLRRCGALSIDWAHHNEANTVSDEPARGSTEQDGPRLGQPQERMRHLRGVSHSHDNLVPVIPNSAHDYLAGVHAQADSPLLLCLRRQRSI
jgi:hypothetical protein